MYACHDLWEYFRNQTKIFLIFYNSLGPSDAIWHWRYWSRLVQVMACCLKAPSHYLNQCWLIISKVLWHSSEDIIIRRFEDTNTKYYIFKITLRSPRANELTIMMWLAGHAESSWMRHFNSLFPWRCGSNFKSAIFKLISWVWFLRNLYEIALMRTLCHSIDSKSKLVQVMAWCHQATIQYMS